MARRNRSPQRQARLPSAAPVSPPPPPPPPPPAPDVLHFRTGIMGGLARFFARRRAAGDPYDETLVFPALIVIIFMNLNHVKGFGDWTVTAAITGTALISGAWLGASLGMAGGYRAMLRSISVGEIEAAVFFLIYGKVASPAKIAYDLIFLNFFLFWFAHLMIGTLREIALVTEREWQATIPRRMFIRRMILLVFYVENLRGEPIIIVIIVRAIQFMGPLLLLAWLKRHSIL
jgi:hypothetical protein